MKYRSFQGLGFTLVELVIVIVLMGILSFYAVPRFVGFAEFKSAGFYQEVVSATRYAHRLAVGRGDSVAIRFKKHEYQLYYRNRTEGYEPLPETHPVSYSKSSVELKSKDDTPSIPVSANFTALGRCKNCNNDLTITIGGNEMTIFQETGYVNST